MEYTSEVVNLHNNRRLFIIIDNKLYLETKPTGLCHIDWVRQLFTNNSQNITYSNTRGYVLGNKVVFYKGKDFGYDEKVVSDYMEHFEAICYKCSLKGNITVNIGLVPIQGTIFKPIKEFEVCK